MATDPLTFALESLDTTVKAITELTAIIHGEVLQAQAFSAELQAMADRVDELAGDVAGLGSRVAQLETRPPLRAV